MSGRCRSCNSKMTEFEMTRKEATTGQYVDMCNRCFREADYADIPVLDRGDLGDIDDEDYTPDIDGYPFEHIHENDDD